MPLRLTSLWPRVRAVAGLALLAIGSAGAACRDEPVDAKALIAQGQAHWDAQRFGEAAGAFGRAVRADPANGEARLKYAEALWKAGQYSEGAREAIRAADLLPDNLDAQMAAAARTLSLQRFPEAIDRATKILNARPQDVGAMLILGNAHAHLLDSTWALFVLRTKTAQTATYEAALREVRTRVTTQDDQRAERIFRNAVALDPTSFDARLALANFLWAANRQDEAAPLLQELVDEYAGYQVVTHALGAYYLSRGRREEGERYLKSVAGSDREAALTLAEAYQSDGRDADALALLEPLADDPPGTAFVSRASLEFRLGRPDAALARIDDVLKRSPQNGRALEARATFLLDLRRSDEALQGARAAVTAAPTSGAAHYVLGRVLAAKGQPDEAFESFSEAVRLDPGHRAAAKAQARYALDLGRTGAATEMARALTRLEPDDVEAMILLVAALIREGAAAAASTATAAVARFPASGVLLALQADLHASRGLSSARGEYERALQLEPVNPRAEAGLAALDLATRRPEAALRRLEDALRRSPDQPDLLLALGATLHASGNEDAADRTYRRLLSINPGNIEAAVRLAAVLRQRRREPDAIAVIEGVVARRPLSVEPRVALGELLEAAGRRDEAQAQYQKALAVDSRAGVAAYRLAALQSERGGNLDVALDLATRAVQARPGDPQANDVLGWVYVRRNLPRSGVPYLEDCVKAEPRNPLFRYHLGMAYLAASQRQRGRDELQRAIDLAPGTPVGEQAKTALAAALR